MFSSRQQYIDEAKAFQYQSVDELNIAQSSFNSIYLSQVCHVLSSKLLDFHVYLDLVIVCEIIVKIMIWLFNM